MKKVMSLLVIFTFVFSFYCGSTQGVLNVKADDGISDTITSNNTNPTSNNGADVLVDPNASVSGSSTLSGAKVYFTDGYISGEDELTFTTIGTITGSFDEASGILTLSGTDTTANYQAALRSVTYHNNFGRDGNSGIRKIGITIGKNALYYAGTGHYYEFVSDPGITWLDAEKAAASMNLNGLHGYLATITSKGENDFVSSKCLADGWLGATDATDSSSVNGLITTGTGEWYWRTGPEAGTFICSQNSPHGGVISTPNNGEAQNTYQNFVPDVEPNDSSQEGSGPFSHENCAHMYGSGDGSNAGYWNDYAADYGIIQGYLVEFGDLSSDSVAASTVQLYVTKALTVDAPAYAVPTITTQPENQGASQGQSATFSVTAKGGEISYQWYNNSGAISGATSSSYTITSVTASDISDSFYVIATNSYGDATSGSAQIITPVSPVITSDLSDKTVTTGQDVTFSITVSGTPPLTYNWYFISPQSGSQKIKCSGPAYTLHNAQASDAGTYVVQVYNNNGSALSYFCQLTVNTPPSITSQPQDSTVVSGHTATFGVTAAGTTPFTYQWYKNNVAISGATAATLTISTAQPADAGSYKVNVTNAAGSFLSNAAVLTVNTAPAITSQPQDSTVVSGHAVTFSVTAAGTTPFTYQWYKNNVAISGATAATLTISTAQPADAGSYKVNVTNAAGSCLSNAAVLTVNTAPTITSQPQGLTVVGNQNATFSVTASGTAPLTYQWYKDGTAITGANSSNFNISVAQSADAGSYTVKVSNAAGNVTSNAAIVKVDWGNPDNTAMNHVVGKNTGSGDAAVITSSSVDGIGSGNIGVTIGSTTLNVPAAVISGLTSDDMSSTLKLIESPTAQSTLSTITGLIPAQNAVVASVNLDLTKIYSDGTTVVIHQLGGKIKVTLALTDEQIAKITDVSNAKLYYLNTESNTLELVDATFDLSAKTVTFYTDHFSTYVVGTTTPTSSAVPNPKTGDTGSYPLETAALLAICSAAAVTVHSKRRRRS